MTSPKKHRTEILIETHTVTIIRTRGKDFSTQCRNCQKSSKAVSIEQSAALLDTNVQTVRSLIRTGELHFLQIAHGDALPVVCGNSIGERRQSILDSLLKL